MIPVPQLPEDERGAEFRKQATALCGHLRIGIQSLVVGEPIEALLVSVDELQTLVRELLEERSSALQIAATLSASMKAH